MNKKIEFYKNDDEWETVRCPDDGFTIENHKLDSEDWIMFLEHIGISIEKMTVSED